MIHLKFLWHLVKRLRHWLWSVITENCLLRCAEAEYLCIVPDEGTSWTLLLTDIYRYIWETTYHVQDIRFLSKNNTSQYAWWRHLVKTCDTDDLITKALHVRWSAHEKPNIHKHRRWLMAHLCQQFPPTCRVFIKSTKTLKVGCRTFFTRQVACLKPQVKTFLHLRMLTIISGSSWTSTIVNCEDIKDSNISKCPTWNGQTVQNQDLRTKAATFEAVSKLIWKDWLEMPLAM